MGYLGEKGFASCGKGRGNAEELAEVPLIISMREAVRNEIASWFGDYYDELNIAATYNLGINAVAMVRQGVGQRSDLTSALFMKMYAYSNETDAVKRARW